MRQLPDIRRPATAGRDNPDQGLAARGSQRQARDRHRERRQAVLGPFRAGGCRVEDPLE